MPNELAICGMGEILWVDHRFVVNIRRLRVDASAGQGMADIRAECDAAVNGERVAEEVASVGRFVDVHAAGVDYDLGCSFDGARELLADEFVVLFQGWRRVL